jgi:multiple sugar transport system permease protein
VERGLVSKTTTIDRDDERTNISSLDRRGRGVRTGFGAASTIGLILLVLACLGPLILLGKWAVSTSQDIIRDPFAWWPSGVQLENLVRAWSDVGIGHYLGNTLIMVAGSVVFGLLVSLTGAYTIAILKPRYARALSIGVLATLFVPGVITLIPLYLVVLDVPLIGVNLINTYPAVWLPGAANAFTVLLVIRFFENLPGEMFEAARIDGAGAVRIFFNLVLPLSKPIIGVVSLLTIVASWKDFLWPLLVLNRTDVQPLAVALSRLQDSVDVATLMASLFIAVLVPVVLFLVFQRQILRGAGQAGAIKG